LRFHGDVSRLCQSCHNGRAASREAHAVDVAPSPIMAKRIPAGFPLAQGRLDCLTCHDVGRSCRAKPTTALANGNMLRGDPVADPLLLCLRCHAQQDYRPFNAHDQLEAGKPKMEMCSWCHVSIPDINAPPASEASYALRAKSTSLCRNCHTVAADHPFRSHLQSRPSAEMLWSISAYEMQTTMRLPFPELLRYARATQRTPRSIPLEEGRITCSSCHNPHEKGLLPAGNPRSVGAEPKKAVNHRVRTTQGKICVVCHQK